MNDIGHSTLAQAMKAENLFQVRYWPCAEVFTVETHDRRQGQGKTIREAIENARSGATMREAERLAA